ncbi:hypothetical protein KHA80_20460 [Anaerobacillus sp. HL2]|nr:hypothetical protein KHA80_20460 [Anaerobacillus sp. HL2]
MGLPQKKHWWIRDGIEMEIAIEDVVIDDIVVVKACAKIPVDGIVADGYTTIDDRC